MMKMTETMKETLKKFVFRGIRFKMALADFPADYLPAEQYEKLHSLIAAVPDDNHMLHGNYHIKNVMLQNGETLLIGMDTLCLGHPIFEFASIFLAYVASER